MSIENFEEISCCFFIAGLHIHKGKFRSDHDFEK